MRTTHMIRIMLFSILVLILLCPVTNYCDSRPMDAKRLQSYEEQYTQSIDGNGYINSTTHYFYYNNNPELIDSIYTLFIHHTFDNYNTRDSSTIFLSGNLFWENGLKHIHYQTSENDIIDILKDSQNRVIMYDNTDGNKKISSYYDSLGNLDSLYTSIGSYKLLYNDLGIMYTIRSYKPGYPVSIVSITYPTNLIINSVIPNIDEIFQYYFDSFLIEMRLLFDQRYKLQSYTWNGVTVYPSYGDGIWFHENSYNLHLYFYDEGYLTSISEYSSLGESSYSLDTVSFTWESIVPNNDPVAPSPTLSMNVYPNPFQNNVNIELKDKTTTPSDIAIYNIKGQLIRKWSDNRSNSVTWDGKDRFNSDVSSGVYIVKANQDGKSKTSKVVKY